MRLLRARPRVKIVAAAKTGAGRALTHASLALALVSRRQHQPQRPSSRRGPRRCVSGLRRNQESSSRPNWPRIGPDWRSWFGPAAGSTFCQYQYVLRRGRVGGSDCISVWPAFPCSRSRRSSSMRARIVAKSSAARGLFMSPPVPFVAVFFYGAVCSSRTSMAMVLSTGTAEARTPILSNCDACWAPLGEVPWTPFLGPSSERRADHAQSRDWG